MRIWAVNGSKFHPEKEQCVKRNDRKHSCITQDELAKNSLQAGFKSSGKVIVNKLNTNPKSLKRRENCDVNHYIHCLLWPWNSMLFFKYID